MSRKPISAEKLMKTLYFVLQRLVRIHPQYWVLLQRSLIDVHAQQWLLYLFCVPVF